MTTDDWPTFADELGRKSVEQIEKWTAKYTAGAITRRELFIAISTIHDCGSGLAPQDVSRLAAHIHEEIRCGRI